MKVKAASFLGGLGWVAAAGWDRKGVRRELGHYAGPCPLAAPVELRVAAFRGV
jgi:hypothetical protein